MERDGTVCIDWKQPKDLDDSVLEVTNQQNFEVTEKIVDTTLA
jgi:hypothetical protein